MILAPYILAALCGILGLAAGAVAVQLMLRAKTGEAAAAIAESKRIAAESQRLSAETDATIATRAKELQVEAREQVQAEVLRLRETIEKEIVFDIRLLEISK